ncbi:efflux RND transporter periplasmic adaptor subunit [uncultured Bacteroides sp.]|uniref:efflux RND transporter periplasmic adaptor subunit n=1 Tax=uncultured Bacteroides sp. TaxID=162156 RepID=UPI002AA6CCC9|nr:efflux RND transporter periplasmic adaptor subunit [uncultured Bacteroides sp.]
MKRTNIILIGVVSLIIIAIVTTLVINKNKIDASNQVVDRSHIAVTVTTLKITPGRFFMQKSLPAKLNPEEKATASTQVAGMLSTMNIDLGSKVSRGEVIGSIDTKLARLNLQSATLTQQKLKDDYERTKALYKGNATSETELINAKYNYENTGVQTKQIKQQIENAKIIAPISGIVIANEMKAGEFANPGSSIAEIVNISKLKATVYLDETEVYYIHLKQKAEISLPSFPDKKISGNVIYISPSGDENHNYQVDVLIDNTTEWLKAGTDVSVSLTLNQKENIIMIPQRAIVSDKEEDYVYLIDHGIAHVRKVKTGMILGENIEIVNGLSAGNEIVLSGQINLREGSATKVINQ